MNSERFTNIGEKNLDNCSFANLIEFDKNLFKKILLLISTFRQKDVNSTN